MEGVLKEGQEALYGGSSDGGPYDTIRWGSGKLLRYPPLVGSFGGAPIVKIVAILLGVSSASLLPPLMAIPLSPFGWYFRSGGITYATFRGGSTPHVLGGY